MNKYIRDERAAMRPQTAKNNSANYVQPFAMQTKSREEKKEEKKEERNEEKKEERNKNYDKPWLVNT